MLDINDILKLLPQRYPILMVDRILELRPGEYCRGLKNVSANEPFFQGHFPGRPIMPGVLITESLAQIGGVILMSLPENKGKTAYFAAMDKVRFRRPVYPGDALIGEVSVIWKRGSFGKVAAVASVEGNVCVTAELSYSLQVWSDDPGDK